MRKQQAVQEQDVQNSALLNVITPVVLTVLGFILPALAKREQTAAKK